MKHDAVEEGAILLRFFDLETGISVRRFSTKWNKLAMGDFGVTVRFVLLTL